MINNVVAPPKTAARQTTVRLLLGLVVLATFTACPPPASELIDAGAGGSAGSGGAGGGAGSVCAEAPMRLAVTCAGNQCHNPGAGDGRPDFVTPGELEKLIGHMAHEPCPNGQSLVINPTRPFSGAMLERLSGDGCYKIMPPLDAPPSQQLTAADRANLIACVKSWVESKLP